jgi:hypothetical protein
VGKDYLKAIVKSKGFSRPEVDATVKASIDLRKLDQALALPIST